MIVDMKFQTTRGVEIAQKIIEKLVFEEFGQIHKNH